MAILRIALDQKEKKNLYELIKKAQKETTKQEVEEMIKEIEKRGPEISD